MLAAAMALSMAGCGSKGEKATIEEYGGLQEGEESSRQGSGAVSGDPDELRMALAKKLGVDKLQCNDSFDVNGMPVNIRLDKSLPEVGRLPSYRIYDMNEARIDEEKIVKNIFGDTGRVLTDEEIRDRQLQDIEGEDYETSYDDSDLGFSHMYTGKYMGSDYTLTISEWESSIDVILEPDNPGEIIGEEDLKYMNVYCPSFFNLVDGVWTKDGMYISNANGNIGFDENGDPIIVTSENVKDYDIAENMKDRPNRCTKSDDELLAETEHFLNEMLGVYMPSGTINVYGDIYFDSNIDYEKSKLEKENNKAELVFSSTNNYPLINYDSSVRNGYEVAIQPNIAGIEPYLGRTIDGQVESNSGHVDITEEGVIGFFYYWRYYFEEELSSDCELMKFSNIIECFKEGLKENVLLGDYGLSDLYFNDIYLTYAVVSSPDDSGEKSYVPAWSFVGYNNGTPKIIVYINALDGSFVSAEEPKVY